MNKLYLPYLNLLPLSAFMFYARLNNFSDQAWPTAFMLAGGLSVIIVAYLLSQKVIIDRLMLGLNLFFVVGGLAFMINHKDILDFYDNFKGPAFFIGICLVGTLTTLFSPYGFVGIDSDNKRAVNKSSRIFLAGALAALLFSIIFNDYGIIVSIVIPFVALRVLQDVLQRKLLQAS